MRTFLLHSTTSNSMDEAHEDLSFLGFAKKACKKPSPGTRRILSINESKGMRFSLLIPHV